MSNLHQPDNAVALVERTKKWFLEIADGFRTAQEKYDLEREFAATKKNRRPWVLLAVLATCLVAAGGAWWLVSSYEQAHNQVRINSQEFNDIAQRDLLDAAKNIEADLDYALTTLSQLKTDLQTAIDKVNSDYDDALVLARTSNLKPDVLAARQASAAKTRDAAIAALKAKFARDNAPAQKNLEDIRSRLAAFDQTQLESARKQEVILNSERKVYDLEKARFKEGYEAQIQRLIADNARRLAQKDVFISVLEKQAHDTLVAEQIRLTKLYNPTFDDADAQVLLSHTVDEGRLTYGLAKVPQIYLDDGVLTQANVDLLNTRLAEYHSLITLMQNTPYLNSVPPLVHQLYARSLELVDLGTSYFDPFYRIIKKRDATIAELNAKIDGLNAVIDDQRQQIAALTSKNAAVQSQLEALNQLVARGTSPFETQATTGKLEAFVVSGNPADSPTAYVRANAPWAADQRVVAVRDGAALGEFVASGTGVLRSLSPVVETAPSVVLKYGDAVVRKEVWQPTARNP